MEKTKFSIPPPLFQKPTPQLPTPKPLKTRFRLEQDFFDELLKRLEERRSNRSKLFGKVTRPRFGWFTSNEEKKLSFTNLSRDILSELIETAFWASLEKEEGRSLEFSISYRCLVNDEDATNHDYYSDLIFKDFRDFTVREVVKLAPAVAKGSSILISASDDKSLKITGISLHGFVPLKISVLEPGKLLISYDMENVAVISGSEVVFVKYSLFVQTWSIWSKLFPQTNEKDSAWNDPRTSVIINTLREMRKLGHGGILIVVPCNKKFQKSIELPIPFCSNSLFTYGSETIEYLSEKKKENKDYYGYETSYLAEYFSRFTAVDGATILTRKLDLVGFGIILKKASRKKLPRIYKLDPLDHEEWFKPIDITNLGKTRHQSAARFVCSQPDSVAFVVSQDGGITALSIEENKENRTSSLYAYSKMELTLF